MNCQFPPIPEKVEAFQWQRNGAWRVGVRAIDTDGELIERGDGMDNIEWLMKVSHDGGLEWVFKDTPKRYPQRPIPEPTK